MKEYQIDVDFGAKYGKDFTFLNSIEPKSLMLAEGSPLNVLKGKKLEDS